MAGFRNLDYVNHSKPLAVYLILGFIIFSISFLNAQETEMKRFALRGIYSTNDIAIIDSTIRSLDGVDMLRTDFNTKNCIGLFSSEMSYTQQFFIGLLEPLGYGIKCYTSQTYSGQLLKPMNPYSCRELISVAATMVIRGTGGCCQDGGNGTGGCENAACEAAICALDAFCCDNTWDGLCVLDALDNANSGGVCAGVSDCPGAPVAGPCCQAGGNGSPGCDNASCETAVCTTDPFCCNISWDGVCAGVAVDNANFGGACAGVSDCPSGPAANPCCTGHPFLGCENAACQTAVCNSDPFCCDTQWDGLCATVAEDNANDGGACSGVSDCPSGSGNPVTAGDCDDAIDVCTDINFQVDPNGYGSTNEIPPLGTTGNPDLLSDGTLSPWGTDNEGCLRSGELNSTWMIVNIQTGGVLEFTFGGLGTQSGFYDWIMYPYDENACTDIPNNNVAPVRCNWNLFANGGTGLANPIPPGGNAGNFEPPLNVNAGDQFVICFSNWSSVTTNVPLEFDGTADVSCTPLPVELLQFDGHKVGEDALLEWTTATEINNDLFFLNRSVDGENWKKIATIPGNGNSNQQIDYSYRDQHPGPELHYYRLYQQDYNGLPKLIGTAAINFTVEEWIVFPNPSNGSWRIQTEYSLERMIPELLDAHGQKVPFRVEFKNEELIIHLSQPKSGLYFFVIRDSSGSLVSSQKLLVH